MLEDIMHGGSRRGARGILKIKLEITAGHWPER